MPDDDKKARDMRQLVEASSIGWMFPIAIGIGYVMGHYLDKWLGTDPWLTVIFTLLGIIAAFRNLFRLAKDE
ncbi:MAG TPA: AtpZ/AtpI family protein [Thermoanaerobaculia bacterium]|nr:AtpZ/AtpI family protein [Thermoanaerobaculia bacterium]